MIKLEELALLHISHQLTDLIYDDDNGNDYEIIHRVMTPDEPFHIRVKGINIGIHLQAIFNGFILIDLDRDITINHRYPNPPHVGYTTIQEVMIVLDNYLLDSRWII